MKFPYTKENMYSMMFSYIGKINDILLEYKLSQEKVDLLDGYLLDLQGMLVASTPFFGKVCFLHDIDYYIIIIYIIYLHTFYNICVSMINQNT